ncbi:MAG TPA: hypothetical protein VLA99_00760 [Nitrospiraceae bacterium]|nr:hypothetical protein [Nitrospiraceae bacterium]
MISKSLTTVDVSGIAPIEGFAAPQLSIARLIDRMLGLTPAAGEGRASDKPCPRSADASRFVCDWN